MNGSGKTLAFGVPSLLRVDPSIPKVQVFIIANTRELIRQVQQVLQKVAFKTQIKISTYLEEMKVIAQSHIVVAVPEFLDKCCNKRNPLDVSALKLIVYDEADEIFLQENNHKFIAKLNSHLLEKGIQPQNLLYSATYDDVQIANINKFFVSYKKFQIKKEALRLKGVQLF